MFSSNRTVNKTEIVKSIQTSKNKKFDVRDVVSTQDKNKLIKDIETKLRRGRLSVILVDS